MARESHVAKVERWRYSARPLQNNLRGRLDDPVLVDAFVKLGPTLEQLWLNESALLLEIFLLYSRILYFPTIGRSGCDE
jgi:hypothetical protein